nr:hypothetical protein [uncultured Rhodopila sp.]
MIEGDRRESSSMALRITRGKGCYGVLWIAVGVGVVDSVAEARKRQIARVDGTRRPTVRKAMAVAKFKAHQDGADAAATLRAYATDVANLEAWRAKHGLEAMPATPEVVGVYLAAAGEGYAMPTWRRRVAAIARACDVAGHPLDTKHPAIRETLRGVSRKHGTPARQEAALTTADVRKLAGPAGQASPMPAPDVAIFPHISNEWLRYKDHCLCVRPAISLCCAAA